MSKFSLGFISSYFVFITLTFFVDASWGAYLYQLLYFLNPIDKWWYQDIPDLRYSFIVSFVLIASLFLRYSLYATNKISDQPQTKWLICMIVYIYINYINAAWPEMHMELMINFSKLLLFLFVAYKIIDTPKKLELLLNFYLLGSFYVGWSAHSTGRFSQRLEGIGPADSVGANGSSAVMITSLPLLIYYILEGKNWQKIVAFVFIAYNIDSIVLMNSRGAFLGLALGCCYFFYKAYFLKLADSKMKFQILGIVVMGVLLFFRLTDDLYWERMGSIQGDASTQEGGGTRIHFWMSTFQLVADNPFGVGYWGYQKLSPQILPQEWLTHGMRALHSIWFQSFSEFGYIAIPLIFGLISSNFLLVKKLRRHFVEKSKRKLALQITAIEAGLISFLIAGTFLDCLYVEIMYWFFLYIACFSNIYLIKECDELS